MNEDTRKALELARDALQRDDIHDYECVMNAIDAALADPAVPVAQPLTFAEFMSALADAGVVIDTETAIRIKEVVEAQHGITKTATPAAPVAQPLTDEQILASGPAGITKHSYLRGWRDCERANGITKGGAA